MTFLKYIAVLPFALSCIAMAEAKSDIFYTVPFHDAEVKAASKIYINYHFDSHSQTLGCHSNLDEETITSIEWRYKDATRKIDLPVILKDDARFKGHFADPEGKLIITNDFGSSMNNGSIFVSCEYHNMK